MHQEFLTKFTESSTRLAGAWTDALKKAKIPPCSESEAGFASGWMNPWVFSLNVTSPSAAARFQEMLDMAAEDLPELIKHSCDSVKLNRIRDRWASSYEKLVSEMFGIPPKSDTELLAEQWREILGSPSRTLSGTGRGLFLDLPSMISSMGWLLPWDAGAESDFWKPWMLSYEKTVGRMFRFPEPRLAAQYHERLKRVLDAQVGFLGALPQLQEQLVRASEKAIERVIHTIAGLDIEKITSETYRRFQRAWIAGHEEAFSELFRSDAFIGIVCDSVQRGEDAKRKLRSFVEETLSFWSFPGAKNMEAVQQEMHSLKDQVRKLQKDVADLKALLNEVLTQRAERENP